MLKLVLVLVIVLASLYLLFKLVSPPSVDQKCPFDKYRTGGEEATDKTTVMMETYSEPSKLPSYSIKIPRRIVQTHERPMVPKAMYEALTQIREYNPTFSHTYYDAESRRIFVESVSKSLSRPDILKAYDSIVPGAYQADLFRVCELLINGGVYVDSGHIAVSPDISLEDILGQKELVISVDTCCKILWDVEGLSNSFIAAVPGHPVLLATLNLIVDRVLNKDYGTTCVYTTGPVALADGYKLSTGKNSIYAIPSDEIKVLQFTKIREECLSGIIKDSSGKNLYYTKYPLYLSDSKWYNNGQPQYSVLWSERKAFV